MSRAKRKVNELEKEFRDIATSLNPKIKEELDKALEHIKRAEELSEEYGVPFSSPVAMQSDYYVPASFHDKFLKRSKDPVEYDDDDDDDEELTESINTIAYEVCKVDSIYTTGWNSDGWSMSSLNC